MAKYNPTTVSNIGGNPTSAANTINSNLAAISTALENTLSRDGTSPNQMAADLDMNQNDILNVDVFNAHTITIDGAPVYPGQGDIVTSVAGRIGDVVLTKSDVGLAQVDNTSDINKPVSTATQTALNAKTDKSANLSDLTNAATARANLGLGNVDNTSDINKPVSTATQTALNGKQNLNARLTEISSLSYTRGDLLWYNGSNLTNLGAGTSGQVLATGGTGGNPSWQTVSGTGTVTSVGLTVPSFLSVTGSPINTSGTFAVTLSGTALPVTSGGTGQNSFAVGDLLYASSTTALSRLADVATGNALISGGVNTAPSWGKISLTTTVSGVLPVANGGTSISSVGTNGQILTVVSSAPAWADQITFRAPDMWVQDERTAGTNGDAASATMTKATLNTVKRNVISGASVASSQITLPAGTYYCKWRTPYNGNSSSTNGNQNSKSRLRDTTNSVTLSVGSPTTIQSASPNIILSTDSHGIATFTLSGTAVLELQRAGNTASGGSFGFATNFSEIEVYASVEIWKVG